MSSESTDDKLSIKSLLFTKAIPNYVIPIPTMGHKVYPCIDCGDRFLFKTSYEYHINRQSVLITYMCRHCEQIKQFRNRCRLLSHIRSHVFKSATINVSDLKVEPLPANYFEQLAKKCANVANNNEVVTQESTTNNVRKPNKFSCLECKQILPVHTLVFKERANHYMQYTNKVHACPVCLFALPTLCGLKTHLRLHTRSAPFFCPECGIILTKKTIQYPFHHDCEGFRMMRATTRYQCPVKNCQLFHPNEYKLHMKTNHLKKVYKCPICVVACFHENTIAKHLASHQTETKAIIFYQCELCPGRLVLQNQMDNHLRGHISNSSFVYPCWACGQVMREVRDLLKHYSIAHGQANNATNNTENAIISNEPVDLQQKEKSLIYRVVKRCDKCKRSFTYKCKYEQISVLPNECPFKCAASKDGQISEGTSSQFIKCHLCGNTLSQDWTQIKKHYAKNHKEHRCLDAKLVLNKINIKNYNKKKKRLGDKHLRVLPKRNRTKKRRRNRPLAAESVDATSLITPLSANPLACLTCGFEGEDKDKLQEHFLTHRDPYMAYQCMECGKCFVVKPSFTTHLLLVHNISSVDEYILEKHCYNAAAMLKNEFCNEKNNSTEEPLRDNQCQICRDEFDDSDELEKHFRVHGMAFLKRNTNKSSP